MNNKVQLATIRFFKFLILLLLTASCSTEAPKVSLTAPPLPSWNNGKTKEAIINFVTNVTNEQGPDFVPIQDRIAVFDNDGCLWSEQPMYFQLFYALDKVKEQAGEHPEWKTTQPFKAVLENDMQTLATFGAHEILKIAMVTHSGMTSDEFETSVKKWITTAKHPKTNKLFTEMVFQPMLELIEYLQQNNFKTFIVSGGGIDFMRAWAEDVYKIPCENVVGSSIKSEFVIMEGKPVIKKLPEIEFIDDGEGKPVGIHKFIGRKPIFCAGNSDGDLAMMEYTASNKESFMLYIHHTDAEREWAYDRTSSVGTLDKGLDEAINKGWTIMDMKKDWKVIYPFDLK